MQGQQLKYQHSPSTQEVVGAGSRVIATNARSPLLTPVDSWDLRPEEARGHSKVPSLGDKVDCHATPRVEMRDCGWGAGGGGRRRKRRHPWGMPKFKRSVRGGGWIPGSTGGDLSPCVRAMTQHEPWEEAARHDTQEVTADLKKAVSVGGCGWTSGPGA